MSILALKLPYNKEFIEILCSLYILYIIGTTSYHGIIYIVFFERISKMNKINDFIHFFPKITKSTSNICLN